MLGWSLGIFIAMVLPITLVSTNGQYLENERVLGELICEPPTYLIVRHTAPPPSCLIGRSEGTK